MATDKPIEGGPIDRRQTERRDGDSRVWWVVLTILITALLVYAAYGTYYRTDYTVTTSSGLAPSPAGNTSAPRY